MSEIQVHDRVYLEVPSKITYVLVILRGSEERDGVPFQFLQRASKDGTWESEFGNSQIQLIDHLRSPPQGPQAGIEPALA
jgi:hypothetical protein